MGYRKTIGRVVSLSVIVTVLGFAGAAKAATITYLGGDSTTQGQWYNSAVAKSAVFDPNGDNKYGSDGYNMSYRGVASGGGAAMRYEIDLPAYIASATDASGLTYWGAGVYPKINDPTGPDDYIGMRQIDGGSETDMLIITIAQDASFVLGVLSADDEFLTVLEEARLRQTSGGIADTGLVSLVGPPDTNSNAIYENFFSISANAGDIFVLSGRHSGSDHSGIVGVTFEVVPEPASLALLVISGMVVGFRRKACVNC